MKKVLSFVLVLAMILGSVSMVFAERRTDVFHVDVKFDKTNAQPFVDAPNSKLATVLRDLNVLVGNEGKVFLDQTISRAEVCAILMRVLGYESYCTADYAIAAAGSFKDVASGYWANGYINLAAQLGYVNGVGSGKFNPTGNVGLNDGVAFIMKALGYSADHLPLEWPYNFLVKGEELGLLKGVDLTATDLTREQMFTILYNALDLKFVKWNPDTVNLFVNQNDKVGEYKEVTTGLNTFAKKAAGEDAKLANYSSTGSAVVCPALIASAAAAKALDLSAYEGQYVEYVKAGNDILFVSNVLSTKLSGDYASKGAVQTVAGVSILAGADGALDDYGSYILWNGTETNALVLEPLYTAASLEDVVANVVLDKDGKIEAIASLEIWYPTASFQVSEAAAKLAAAGVVSYAAFLDTLDTNYVEVYTDTSKSAVACEFVGVDGIEEIAEDDIITIYADANKAVNRIVVVRDVVENVKLTKVVSTKYTFDNGKTYELANEGKALAAIRPSTAYNFTTAMSLFLNGEGKIVESRLPEAEAAKVEYTTGYAVVAKQEQGYTYTWDSTKFERVATTNNAITLVPFGAPEAVKFENVSVAGLATAGGWDVDRAAGSYVEYKVSLDGALLWISPASFSEGIDGVFKNGVVAGKYLAKDVVIVNALNPAVATGRGILEASALEGKNVTGKAILSANGAVATLIVTKTEAAAVPATSEVVSPVAIIDTAAEDANGKIVVYFDGELKSAYASGAATAFNAASLYALTLDKASGKVTSFAEVTANKQTVDTKAVTVSAVADGVEAVQYDASNFYYVANPTVWVVGEDGMMLATEATLAENIKEYFESGIDFYQVGNITTGYNFVVIY